MEISGLGLPPVIVNQLRRAHYTETQQLLPLSDEELRGIKGIGPGYLKAIRERLSTLDPVDEQLDRVRTEADEKIRVAAEAADQTLERANAVLAEAEELTRQAHITMGEAEDKAEAVLTLTPLLKGEKLVREYYRLLNKKWEWPFQGERVGFQFPPSEPGWAPSKPPPAAVKVIFTLSGGQDWMVLADIKGDSTAILKELLNHPVLLEELGAIVQEAHTAADKLSELSRDLWPLIEPVELARQFLSMQDVEGAEA